MRQFRAVKCLLFDKKTVTGIELTTELHFRPCQRRFEHLPLKLRPKTINKEVRDFVKNFFTCSYYSLLYSGISYPVISQKGAHVSHRLAGSVFSLLSHGQKHK
jgi:hypothetical protein